jgi:hypothetical protein
MMKAGTWLPLLDISSINLLLLLGIDIISLSVHRLIF